MNWTRFAVLTMIAVLFLAACQPGAAPIEEPAVEESPITIGVSLPLSGNFENPGIAAKQGYEVWVALVNEAGGLLGRQVELIVLDNASDPDTAVSDYEKLITEDAVDLVVGPFSSMLVIPTSQVAADHNYAFIEPAGGAPDVFNRGLTNIFFAQPSPSVRQADPFTSYVLGLSTDERPETFAVVSQDDPFALGVTSRLKTLLTDGEIELVLDITYDSETQDFSEIASEVASLDPDLIVGGTLLEDSIAQIQAYQEANYQPRLAYFTMGPTVPGPFRSALGDATEGIFSSISWFPEGNDFQNEAFTAKYMEMFEANLGDIAEDAANAFTVGQVLQQAVENIESIDNEALIEELHQGTYNTIVGSLNFDSVGQPEGSYMIMQWQGDNYVIVGPSDRAEMDPLPMPKSAW